LDLDLEVKAITGTAIFAGVDPCKLRLLACMSEQVHFDKGENLFRAGDAPDAAYIVLSGNVELIMDTADGEAIMARHTTGAIIGEIALLCDAPRIASARASTELSVIRINKECLLRMMQDSAQFSIAVARQLAWRITELAKRETMPALH
jgi:CRP-like cAMP-binding protein